jgi:uncharacterized membrane protein YeaQ/YmgE (transglycosylase-associated protein family)
MDWIVTIAIGFVAGILGRFLMPGKNVRGCIITTILGVGGAAVGRFVAEKVGIDPGAAGSAWDIRSMAVSVAGVMVILLIYRVIVGARGR